MINVCPICTEFVLIPIPIKFYKKGLVKYKCQLCNSEFLFKETKISHPDNDSLGFEDDKLHSTIN